SLSLGNQLNDVISQKISALESGFAESVKSLQLVSDVAGNASTAKNGVEWYQLNAIMPNAIPSGDRGNAKDIVVYDNAQTTIGVGNETRQIAIGSLVKISDNNWRVIDVPQNYDENQLLFTFVQPSSGSPSLGGVQSEMVSLISEVQKIQEEIQNLPIGERAEKHKAVIALMLQIMSRSVTIDERDSWIRQIADTLMEASSGNEFPEASSYFETFYATIKKQGNNELSAYVLSRYIMTDFYLETHAGDEMKAFLNWLDNLEKLVNEYGETESGIDGMMQLASHREMTASSTEEPQKWYTKVIEVAANKPVAEKAKGAIRRLTSAGKAIPFSATDVDGKPFDIASLQGKNVLLYFWDSRVASQLPASKVDFEKLTAAGLVIIGVNLDNTPQEMKSALSKAGVTWPQLHAPGGLDGPLAVYWGIQNTPYMILYGKDGKVVAQNILSAEDTQRKISAMTE
ncbi:MAG: TlpA family protein disulfide reductase, partial [Thermoguttaceae bacterium]